MNKATVEHINITVHSAEKTAVLLTTLFDWKIRWKGDSIQGGTSIHVGGDHSYIALYQHDKLSTEQEASYFRQHGLNHIGIVVDDLDAIEAKVIQAGLQPHSHADYEPGRRFYFKDETGLEIEVISYDQT